MKFDCDVAIIGAGVSGLAAASVLTRAGKSVRCLEAASRVGGRILTVHDPLAPLAIELGAEFVHGRPPETWELIQQGSMMAYEHSSSTVHMDHGKMLKSRDVEDILPKSVGSKDRSFEDFISRSNLPTDVKFWARRYVEGFNAARTEVIGVRSLTEDAEAAHQIEGDRAFRIPGGYDQIPLALLRSIADHSSAVHLNFAVERVRWRRGSVEIFSRGETLRCRQVIVTVSLGVLQSGAIQFDPEPTGALKAAETLKFGHVYRVTFRFDHAFWEEDERLKCAGFLFSKEQRFPTWWTTAPVISPILTGWMAGSAAEESGSADLPSEALESLAKILNRKIPPPQAVYFHDWQADPFVRGAYSYVPVGASAARAVLSEPLDGTLFFAGEATNTTGHSGTVHGAIESGYRVANNLL